MKDDFIHKITENSCFFQGHINQFFSRKFNRYLSFRIQSNYSDINKNSDFNIEKYRPIFSKHINPKIALRKNDGGDFHEISPDNLKIEAIKLIDDQKEEGICGRFEIYPPTALCKKDNCNHYFVLTEGRKCGHKDTDPWEQFTFLNFCNECGRLLPLHYMTNVNNCKKCGLKYNAVSSLIWTRGKDEISSYKVKCKKCGNIENLIFQSCNHEDEKRSKCPPKKFQGIPTRANAIIHPFVITIPDIPQEDEIDKSGRKTTQGKVLSEAFNSFFGFEFEEAKIHLPEFKNALLEEVDFWNLSKINDVVKDVYYDLNMDIPERSQIKRDQFLKILKRVLKNATISIQDGADRGRIEEKYGINFIKKALSSVEEINFDENDLEGMNLLCSTNIGKRDRPNNFYSDYETWCDEFGLKKVMHYPDINMVQALLGIIEGSTRRNPMLFRTIETGKYNLKKPTVFVKNFFTEAILFQLDCTKILNWLHENQNTVKPALDVLPPEGTKASKHYRHVISKDGNCRKAVNTLLHTYSHMIMQQSTIDTGLDIQSISEKIFPNVGSIFIYSTNSINIGGLEYTFDYHLEDWFSRVKELANDCPQDPACMIDEGGACNACSYVPEFVCFNFNQDIDRSALVGGSDRFAKGYLA
jgi:DNA-directed RNA polymerase subunit M/transcription elongation factor TFIIS